MHNSLWTPILDDSSQPDLLRVISNVWTDTEYNTSVVVVRAFHNFWQVHVGFKWRENDFKASVIELALKLLERFHLVLSFASCGTAVINNISNLCSGIFTFCNWKKCNGKNTDAMSPASSIRDVPSRDICQMVLLVSRSSRDSCLVATTEDSNQHGAKVCMVLRNFILSANKSEGH